MDELQQRLALIADTAPVLLSYVDAGLCYRYANEAYARWFGYAPAEVVGRPVAEIIGEAAFRAVRHHVEAALSGQRVTYEAALPFARSGTRYIHAEMTPDLDERGEVRGFVSVTADITAGREAELENQRLVVELQAERVKQYVFLRDVLHAVTDGKLRLCQLEEEMPPPLERQSDPIPLTPAFGLWDLRHGVQDLARAIGFPEARWRDFVTAASEAGMNAVVHAGGGEASASADPRGFLQVRVQDHGAGILMEHLPHAALTRGYSTKNTLGHGLKMMLATADRVFVLTGPTGTTVVLEQDRVAPPPAWLQG